MSRENLNPAQSGSEIPKESQCLHASEEAEIPEPQGLLTGVHELEMSCRTENQEKSLLQSEVRGLHSEVKFMRTKETYLKKQVLTYQEELSKLRDNWKGFNSQLEAKDLEVADLRAEVTRLREMCSENTEIKEELARVLYLQFNEKSAREINETHMRKLEEELVLSKTMTVELEALREKQKTEVENLKAEVDYLKSLRGKKHTESEQLRAAVKVLQDNEKILNEQNANLTDVVAQLECLNKTNQAEKENLWVEVYDLQEHVKNMKGKNKSLIDEVDYLESLRKTKQNAIESLRTAVHNLQGQVREAQQVNRDKDEVSQKLTHAESLMEKQQAEMKKLRTALHDVQKKENFLEKQNDSITNELAHLESRTEKRNEENKNLKTVVKDLQYNLDGAEQVILDKDELISKHYRELAYKQEVIEEIYILNTDLKQSICDLKDQLATHQEEQILAVENFAEESRKAENAEQQDSPEEQSDDSLLENTPEEQEPESLLETPPAEIQTTGFWRRFAKGLRKFGLYVGIASVGLLIPVAIIVNSLPTAMQTLTALYERVFTA